MRRLALVLLLLAGCVESAAPTPSVSRNQSEADQLPAQWNQFDVGDLSLETPLTLRKAPQPRDRNPRMPHVESHSAVIGDQQFCVLVIRQTFRPGTDANLDGAALYSVIEAAKNLGDVDPQVTIETCDISGVRARQASYRNVIRGKRVWMDSLCVLYGEDLYAVAVIRQIYQYQEVCDRILKSVRLNGVGPKLVVEAQINAPPDNSLPPYDPDYRLVEAWIKENDTGPMTGRQRWWPVVDQMAIHAELQPKYAEWRKSHPGEQEPPAQFEELYEHEQKNMANGTADPLVFPQKLLRLRYLIDLDGLPRRRDRVFVLHDGVVRRVTETDVVFLKSYQLMESFRADMLLSE